MDRRRRAGARAESAEYAVRATGRAEAADPLRTFLRVHARRVAALQLAVLSAHILLGLAASLSAAGAPFRSFQVSGLSLASRPGVFVVDDLDGVGSKDVVVVHPTAGTVSVLPGGMDGNLGEPRTYAAGLSPLAIAAGDLDADGDKDLVVANYGSSTLSVFLNRGSGEFSPAAEVPVPAGPRDVRLADFDGDGALDAVAVGGVFGRDLGFMTALRGDGGGGFASAVSYTAGDNAHSVALDDYDGDRLLDIAYLHTGTLAIVLGRGGFAFQPPWRVGVSSNPRFLVTADFKEDGFPDIAITTDGSEIYLLENLGGRAFQERRVFRTGVGGYAEGAFLRAEDFDRDGRVDLVTQVAGAGGSYAVVFLRGAGDGTFSLAEELSLGLVTDFHLSDLDGDGLLEGLAAVADPPGLLVLRGGAPGFFDLRRRIALGTSPREALGADLDGDGKPEVVVLGERSVAVAFSRGGREYLPVESSELGGIGVDMVAGDLDGASGAKVVVADLVGGKVLVLEHAPGGGLRERRGIAVGGAPRWLGLGDLDGDARPDLAVADAAVARVSVVLGPGLEAEPVVLEVSGLSGQKALVVGDADGDGAGDIVVAGREGLLMLLGDGRGGFPRRRELPGLKDVLSLGLGDVDGSGLPDVVAARSSTPGLAIVRDAAIGAQASIEYLDEGVAVRALELGDLDGDGKLELVYATGSTPASLVVRRSAGGGAFSPGERVFLGTQTSFLSLADLDRDGRLDAVMGSGTGVLIFWGEEGGPRFRRGDANADGAVNITDVFGILGALFLGGEWPKCEDAADADDGGSLNLTDAVALLAYLFRGGPRPPDPGPEGCGVDPTEDELGCEEGGCP